MLGFNDGISPNNQKRSCFLDKDLFKVIIKDEENHNLDKSKTEFLSISDFLSNGANNYNEQMLQLNSDKEEQFIFIKVTKQESSIML